MLRDYQEYALSNFIKNDKSMFFWSRQTGKSFVINKMIENFVINNNDKKIFFIIDYKKYFRDFMSKIRNDINNVVVKYSSNNINFINNNKLTFCSITDNFFSILTSYNPELIVIDGFSKITNGINNVQYLNMFINMVSNKCKCKCIFTFEYNINIIKTLDYKNDYYINIIPYDINDTLMIDSSYKLNSNILKDLSYKPYELLDYSNLSYIRKKKIKKLNSLNSI